MSEEISPVSPGWFFKDPENVARFQKVWRVTLGTPFRKNLKGSVAIGRTGGVYCAGLVGWILEKCGAIKACSFPHDSDDYQPHRAASKIAAYLRGEITEDPQSAYLASRFAEIAIETGNRIAETGKEEPNLSGLRSPVSHLDLMVGDIFIHYDATFGFHMPMVTDAETGQCVHASVPSVGECRLTDSTFAGSEVAHFRCRALPKAETGSRKAESKDNNSPVSGFASPVLMK